MALDETLSIRISSVDKSALAEKAERCKQSLPDYARETLLGAVRFAPDYRALLAEVLGMRMVVLSVCSELAQGRSLSSETLQQLVATAEARKFTMADERIARYLED